MHAAPDDPWAAYERTIVTIRRPAEGDLAVQAAPSAERGRWPWSSPAPVFLLTAWDPGEERPGPVVNRRRQVALEAELRPLAVAQWAASGIDPASGARDEGVAVRGLSEAEVLELGARYGQAAVFAWTPLSWAIVACSGRRRVVCGWRLVEPEPRPASAYYV